ncbi:HAMP domain-containing sensor histidine kinase [Collinsella tanakaei]|uniref:sensor histidine kinase n=1 Tax=Collinsella tanakaei TaxID=626935 RepID=UPI0025A3DE8F|nr:HAMP domain-containing sensor histidine kinase [Collinsella tanakaei]MDM8245648.1 HAMP domain-containing sensor histidine kinase [Collinsella tanakaei]
MDTSLLAIILLVVGLGMGALLVGTRYLGELRRIARFLRGRDPQSNARVTAGGAPGVTDLADAVNAELDRSAQAHIEALRHQQEFQRDLSALSHDIRTPLMGAKGYLQLARDEGDPAQRARHLDAAAARIDTTTELLDQLFAYTKSTDPDLALKMEPVALKPFVEEILLGQYPAFEERGWEPQVTFEDATATLEADREALARILTNLVVNALRHGSSAPSIFQRTENGRVLLGISNTVEDPTAIDPDRLFDRFYQADSARGAKGSGLGLSVAANLARAMGMKLSAELTGNTLTITLG